MIIKDRALTTECQDLVTDAFFLSISLFFAGVVEELTGEPPVDFRSFVREKKGLLGR